LALEQNRPQLTDSVVVPRSNIIMLQLLMPIVSLILIRSLDTEDVDVQRNVYMAFGAVHVLILIVCAILWLRVRSSTDTTMIDVPPQKVPFQSEDQQGPTRRMEARDYDMEQYYDFLWKRVVMPLGIVAFVCFKWGQIIPLLFQCMHNPVQLYQLPLFKIYLLGHEARGDLARPFPQPDLFGFMSKLAPKPQVVERKKYM
jgi:hypothetical protein